MSFLAASALESLTSLERGVHEGVNTEGGVGTEAALKSVHYTGPWWSPKGWFLDVLGRLSSLTW